VASSTLNFSPYSEESWPIKPLRENPDILKYDDAERTAFCWDLVKFDSGAEGVATGLGAVAAGPGAVDAKAAGEGRAGVEGVAFPPKDIPMPPRITARINPPPHPTMALPFRPNASPSQSRMTPKPAVAPDATVSRKPTTIANIESGEDFFLGGAGDATGEADAALTVAAAPRSRPQCLQTIAASWISSVQNGPPFLRRRWRADARIPAGTTFHMVLRLS